MSTSGPLGGADDRGTFGASKYDVGLAGQFLRLYAKAKARVNCSYPRHQARPRYRAEHIVILHAVPGAITKPETMGDHELPSHSKASVFSCSPRTNAHSPRANGNRVSGVIPISTWRLYCSVA